jgi:polyisoprenoid-binding protein YceI
VAIVGEALTPDSLDTGLVYEIDTSKSFITWVGTEPLSWHNGTFKIKSGSLKIVENEINNVTKKKELGAGKIKIDIQSIDILDLKDNPVQFNKLKSHLLSPDFLDADMYPEAEFEMTELEKITSDSLRRDNGEYTTISPTHILRGNLTIRGITKGIEFPVKIDIRNYKFEASAKFNIDRTKWNIMYRNENDPVARAKDGIIHNIVNVGFEILARQENHSSFGL